MLEIDRDGFDQWDKRIIETLIHKFNGGPVGLTSLAVAVGEEAGTIEEVNEPYLIMEGYIKRTPQGRVATANAYRKLGLKMPTARKQSFVRLGANRPPARKRNCLANRCGVLGGETAPSQCWHLSDNCGLQ